MDILLDNLDWNNSNMDSGMFRTNHPRGGQSYQPQCQGNGHCSVEREEKSASPGISNKLCEEQEFSVKSKSDGVSRCIGPIHPDIIKKKQAREIDMTLQDMYNQEDYDDNDEDSDWDPLDKLVVQEKDTNFQDLDYKEDYVDNNDYEDSDWDPSGKFVDDEKWPCINCTMMNLGDAIYCYICGEYRHSEILKHGFFASNLAWDSEDSLTKPELIARDEALCTRRVELSDKRTAVGFDERMLLHSEVIEKPLSHPERPDRLRAIIGSLTTAGILPGRCISISPREITQEELQLVHSVELIESVEFSSSMFSSYFTPDTYANQHSACAARLAAGLCTDLTLAILSGQADNGFALVRPPGHHAGVKQAMGFCLHNNAAVAAFASQNANAKKVLIVDWDVHHGNGTQEIFEGNRSVLYISLHRHEGGNFYPGTGAAHEVGTNGAEGYCVNVPWKCAGVGDNDYLFAFEHIVLPIALIFAPDLTIVSAGFDAARGDPLGCCDITPAGYAHMTQMLTTVSSGKLLVILEGGYNLRSISSSATAVIKVLLGENPGNEVIDIIPSKAGLETILEVLEIQTRFWPSLEAIYIRLKTEYASVLSVKEERKKRKRRKFIPMWWRFGQKRLLYNLLCRKLRVIRKRHARASP